MVKKQHYFINIHHVLTMMLIMLMKMMTMMLTMMMMQIEEDEKVDYEGDDEDDYRSRYKIRFCYYYFICQYNGGNYLTFVEPNRTFRKVPIPAVRSVRTNHASLYSKQGFNTSNITARRLKTEPT